MTIALELMRRAAMMAVCMALFLGLACCSLLGDDDGNRESSPPPGSGEQPTPTGGTGGVPGPGAQPTPTGGGAGKIVIQPGGGLPGNMQVTSEGRNVWPPQGPGCDRLVACCQAAGALASDISLFCQMSVAVEPVSCTKALQDVRSYLGERGQATPPQCAP